MTPDKTIQKPDKSYYGGYPPEKIKSIAAYYDSKGFWHAARFSEDELNLIQSAAKKRGMTTGQYMRNAVLMLTQWDLNPVSEKSTPCPY